MSAAAALRARQAPVKDKYKSDPSSALITLSSSGTLNATSISCKLSTGAAVKQAQKVAGLHPAAGGEDFAISGELCSGDMLLEALVACAGVTLKAVSTALSIPIVNGTVTAEGDLDFRGTMGVDREAPVGFKAIRLGFEIEIDGESEEGRAVDEVKLGKLGKLTERYCVVLQTIVKKPEVSVRIAGQHKGGEQEDGVDRQMLWGQRI
ncbi:OsmC family protein-like protein [Delphinella strobiligena]|nr:OsmC family protein-like protein [Delphinella strobiligena]